MKIKGQIFQLITWEEKKKYFFNMDFSDKPMDCLHIGIIEKEGKWYDRGFFGLMRSMLKLDKPIFKAHNMIFHQIGWKSGVSYGGIPSWIERPHSFKLNDEVEIEINVRKIDSKRWKK